jgi:hypothetical protein
MYSALIGLAATLIGALVGAVVTQKQIAFRAAADRRDELMKLAVGAAIEAHRADREANTHSSPRPLSFYVYFHYEFLHLVESGRAAPDEVRRINQEQTALLETVLEGDWAEQTVEAERSAARSQRSEME